MYERGLVSSAVTWSGAALQISLESGGFLREALGILSKYLTRTDLHSCLLEEMPLVVISFQDESRVLDRDDLARINVDDYARPTVLQEGQLSAFLNWLHHEVRHRHLQRLVSELVRVA